MRFDQIYVRVAFGAEALGVYAASARLAEIGNIIFQVTTLLLAPIFIRKISQFNKINRLGAYFVGILLISFSASIGCIFLGEDIITFIYGQGYREGYTVLSIYVLSIGFVAFGGMATRILASMSISGPQIWAGIAGAGLNVLLSIWWSQSFGLEGVAAATVVSYAVAACLLWRPIWIKIYRS